MPETTASTSFGSLSENHKRRINEFYAKITLSDSEDLQTQLKKTPSTPLDDLETPPVVLLTQHTEAILKTNPALFIYLTKAQQEALENELQMAFYILCMNFHTDSIEHRRQNLRDDFSRIEHCAFLIHQIHRAKNNEVLELKKKEQDDEAAKINWCRLKLKAICDSLRSFSAGKTVYLRKWMSDFNTWRLYWVWAGSMLRMSLQMIPQQFFHVQQTTAVATTPQPTLGYISWILYYTRFLVNFLLVLKHSIYGPWMSEEEKALIKQKGGRWARFKEQLAQKKFSLLNDLVWATGNLLCFFYLVGPALGPAGDILTTCLLIMDWLVSIWKSVEATDSHRKDLEQYDSEITLLTQKNITDKAALNPDKAQQSEDELKRIEMTEIQIAQLQEAKQQCKLDWKFLSKKDNSDFAYSLSLLGAFTIMVFPWQSVFAQATAAGLAMSGAGLCFALSLIYTGYKAYVDVEKSQAKRINVLQQCQDILKINGKLSEADFIRYKDLTTEADQLAKMASYQRYKFLRSVFIQAIIPFAIFTAFTFATFGVGIAISAVGIVLALLTHYLLERKKPKEAELYQFDKDEYENFDQQKAAQNITNILGASATHRLFKSDASPRNKEEPNTALPAPSPPK